MPIRRNLVPSVSRASRSRPAAKMRAASWVGWPSERARVRMRKSAVLSFSVTVAPASRSGLEPRGDVFRRAPQPLLERPELGDVAGRTWSRPRCSWSRAPGLTGRVVDAAREPREPRALVAVAAHQVASRRCAAGRRSVRRPSRASRCCVTLPTPEDQRHRLAAPGRRPPPRGRAPRSRAACRGRRRSWPGTCWQREPDRHRDAELAPRPRRRSARAPSPALMPCSRAVPDRSMNASSIETGSTSGVSSSISVAHLAADARVFRHVRAARRSRAGTAAAPRTSASPTGRRRCARRSRR